MEEITYSAGSIVWVKLSGGKWWPGEVVAPETYPEEVTQGLRKDPIAVVKFFDEDYYEIVKSNNHIHPFVCARKDEFIKKGKELLKQDPNAIKFDKDVSEAKSLCGISNEDKTVYSNNYENTPLSNHFDTVPSKSKHPYGSAMVTSSASLPKPLTSRIDAYGDYKTIEFDSGTDVRIRTQPSPASTPKGAAYACDMCSFQTNRIANIIVHHKSHSEQIKHEGARPIDRGAFSDDRVPFRVKDSQMSLQKVKRKLLSDDAKAKKSKSGEQGAATKAKRKPKKDKKEDSIQSASPLSGTDITASPKKRSVPVTNPDSPAASKRRRKKEMNADSIFDKIKKQAMKKMNRKHANASILSSPANLKRLSKRKDGSDGSSDEEEFLISRGVYDDDVEEVLADKTGEKMETEPSNETATTENEAPQSVDADKGSNDIAIDIRLPDGDLDAPLAKVDEVPKADVVETSAPFEEEGLSINSFVHSNALLDDEDDSPLRITKQVRKDYSRVSRKANIRIKQVRPSVFTENRIERDALKTVEKQEEKTGNAGDSILEQMEKAIAQARKIKKMEDICLDDDSEKEEAMFEDERLAARDEGVEAFVEKNDLLEKEKSPEKEEEELNASQQSGISEELFSDEKLLEKAEELIADDNIIEKAEELIMRDGIIEKEDEECGEEDELEEIPGEMNGSYKDADVLSDYGISKDVPVDETSEDIIVDDEVDTTLDVISEENAADSSGEEKVVDSVVEEIVNEVSNGELIDVMDDSAEETSPTSNIGGIAESETELENRENPTDEVPSGDRMMPGAVSDAPVEPVLPDENLRSDLTDDGDDSIVVVDDYTESNNNMTVKDVGDSRAAHPFEQMALESRLEVHRDDTEPRVPPDLESEPLVEVTSEDQNKQEIESQPQAELASETDVKMNSEPEHSFVPSAGNDLSEDQVVTLDAETGILSLHGGNDIASEPAAPPERVDLPTSQPSEQEEEEIKVDEEVEVPEYVEYTKLQTLVQPPEIETIYLEPEMEVPILEGGEIIHIDNEQVIDTSMDVFCNEIVIESEDKEIPEEYEEICLVPDEDKMLVGAPEVILAQKGEDLGRLPTEAINGSMLGEGETHAVELGQAR